MDSHGVRTAIHTVGVSRTTHRGTQGELCATLPDRRNRDSTSYSMADIGMGAFGVFFMQSPSFLSHQTALERGRGMPNCQTLLGMEKAPTENHIRTMLDPIPPETLFPMFGHTLGAIETGGGLGTFERLGGHVLIALEGTVYFCSQKLVCPNCSSRARQSIFVPQSANGLQLGTTAEMPLVLLSHNTTAYTVCDSCSGEDSIFGRGSGTWGGAQRRRARIVWRRISTGLRA
jgi:hypothetical protein